MKKRMMSMALCLCMALSLAVPTGATNLSEPENETLTLKGFSYSMDGSSIDKDYSYTVDADVVIDGESAYVSIEDAPDELAQYDLTNLEMEKVGDNSYIHRLNDNVEIFLEKTDGSATLLDITVNDRAYAFGGDRLSKVSDFIEEQKSDNTETTSIEDANQDTSISPRATTAGIVCTRTSNKLKFQASWIPANKNQLSLMVNTFGSNYADGNLPSRITALKFENGKVPSSYVIVSANPSGAVGSVNFDSFIDFMINSLTPIKVWHPSYSAGTTSTTNGNNFTFNLKMNATWSSLNYVSSAAKKQGIMMYLFLNHNGVSPVPSGRIVATVHVNATGYFTETLNI